MRNHDPRSDEPTLLSGQALLFVVRYGLVGGMNTAASYAVYCLLLFLIDNYPAASLGSLIFGSVLSFFTLGRYVFMSRLRGRFPKFVGAMVVVYFSNIGLISLCISFGLDAYIAGLVAAPPTVAIAILLQKLVVFRQ